MDRATQVKDRSIRTCNSPYTGRRNSWAWSKANEGKRDKREKPVSGQVQRRPLFLAVGAEAGKNLFTWISCHRFLTLRAVLLRARLIQICCVLTLAAGHVIGAEDASIDRLLKKLPAPEKLVKPSTPQASRPADPALKDPLLISAVTAAMMRNLSQARFYCRKLSEKYPHSEVAAILWGNLAYRLRYYTEAAGAFRKALALAPRDAYTWMDLAIVEYAMGHVGVALDAMAKAAQISPNDGDLAAVLGFSYINLNRIPQAIPPLQRAAKLLPRDYLVQSQLGYCLLVTGQTKTAIGYLQKGASLNSRYGPVWEHLGVAYKKQGRHRDAVSALETATRLLPSSQLAWQHLAEAYQATGRTADAQRAAARAQSLGGAAARANKKKA
jgi:tetratricopeptide (TPR) repeat protein